MFYFLDTTATTFTAATTVVCTFQIFNVYNTVECRHGLYIYSMVKPYNISATFDLENNILMYVFIRRPSYDSHSQTAPKQTTHSDRYLPLIPAHIRRRPPVNFALRQQPSASVDRARL